MKYLHIMMMAAGELWALEPEKLAAVMDFLVLKADGGEVSAEDMARITLKQERHVAQTQGAVGVIPIYGVMGQKMNMMSEISGGTSTEQVASHFRNMLADDAVKAIVLDINSPGGQVQGVEELATEILNSRGTKPIISQINSTAASAAFWVASAADEVVTTPSGQGGSVGVYTIHDNISKSLEKLGIEKTVISSGSNKTEGMPFLPLSEEGRARIQTRVGLINDKFERALSQGRGVTLSHVRSQFGQGTMYLAEEMLERKMVDRIATLPETLERFGVHVNPIASRTRTAGRTRAEASQVMMAKLKAGDQLTARELENGLKGLGDFSNSEAERAVRLLLKSGQGDPDNSAERQAVNSAVARLRSAVTNFPQL